MEPHSWAPDTKRAKRLLLAALVAASTSGCASQRGHRLASAPRRASDEVQTAVETTPHDEADRAEGLIEPENRTVLPTAYTDGVLIASPAFSTQTPREEAQRSIGQFIALDLPEGNDKNRSRNNGQDANGEVDEDAINDDSRENTDQFPPSDVTNVGQPIEYFVSMALARHPKILAAQQRVAAASNVIPQAKALPDPTFNNTFWPFQDQALQTAAGRLGHQMSVNQQVPFPKKLKTKAVIASREVQIAQTEVDTITREITESVRLAYYEVWFATRAIAIIEETKELVADLTDVAEARYRSGGSQQDVLRAQLESDRLDDQMVTLQKQKQFAQADLATLLQQPVTLVPETASELSVATAPQQLEDLIGLAEHCNPKLRGLAWEIQRDRDKQRLACLQKYPDFTVGLNWGLISDDHSVISPVADGHDNLSLSFGTTLPIWREKINAGIREASHRTSSTTQRLNAERDEISGRLRRLIAQADALVEQRNIYEARIIPRTEDTLRLSIADYRGKRTDFYTLIETYRELLMFETQLARIDATLAGTIARLDRTVGCSFAQ